MYTGCTVDCFNYMNDYYKMGAYEVVDGVCDGTGHSSHRYCTRKFNDVERRRSNISTLQTMF